MPQPANNATSLIQLASSTPDYDPHAMHVENAQAFIARMLPRIRATEILPIRSALGRTLAVDVVSRINVPPYTNAAMDGYAFHSASLQAQGPSRLALIGSISAGDASPLRPQKGECVRIMTGAAMPLGTDTVVPQEFTSQDDGVVIVPVGVVKAGDNQRQFGEDLAMGSKILSMGRVLQPADIGLLASLGYIEIAVVRKLRIAVLSTGNELCAAGERLGASNIYDSNRYTLWAMLQRLNADVIDGGIVRDDPVALHQALSEAAASADVVISTGGVGVGESDHTRSVMAELGEVLFWKVAIRPGRPLAVGRIGSPANPAILFGLPGNPVAAMVTFLAFVRDALLVMTGASPRPRPLMPCIAKTRIRKTPGRTEYQRARLAPSADGKWLAELTGSQGSGILSSMSQAHGLLVLPHDSGDIPAGSSVEMLLFDGLL